MKTQQLILALGGVGDDIVLEAGEEASRALYMQSFPGEDPRYPEGLEDNTHTRMAGARKYAAFAADEIRKILNPGN